MSPWGRIPALLYVAFSLVALAVACGGTPESGSKTETGRSSAVSDEVPQVEVPTRWASGNARDLPTLVRSTGTVFVGEVTAFQGQRLQQLGGNTGAITNGDGAENPAARGSASFPISQYEVRVERSLVGAPAEGSTVLVEQVSGVVTTADGSQTSIILEGDESLGVGTRYLFFASVKPNGSLASPPFARFEVEASGLAPLGAWVSLPVARQLAGASVEEAAEAISGAR